MTQITELVLESLDKATLPLPTAGALIAVSVTVLGIAIETNSVLSGILGA